MIKKTLILSLILLMAGISFGEEINTLAKLKTDWAAGGTHTIVANTDGGSGGVYTLDTDLICSTNPLILTATEAVTIDAADTYDIEIDGVDFNVSGVDISNKLVFKRGVLNTMKIKATSSGCTGIFAYCSFDEANAGEGFEIGGALAGPVHVTCKSCSATDNNEDGFDVAIEAVGDDATLICRDCSAYNHTTGINSDGFTAHRANQRLELHDCLSDNCINGVSIIGNGDGSSDGPVLIVNGFIVTNCDYGIKIKSLNVWPTLDISNANISLPTTVFSPESQGISFQTGIGTIQIANTIIKGGASTKYGIFLESKNVNSIIATLENCIVYGCTLASSSAIRTSTSITSLKNCVLYGNNIGLQVNSDDTDAFNCIFMSTINPAFGAWFSNDPEPRNAYNNSSSGNNFFYSNATDFYPTSADVLKITDYSTDPGMIDPAGADFTISKTSNAYQAGNILTASAKDILGITRSDPPDVGAYEIFQLDILLQGDFATVTAWVTDSAEWDLTGGNATFTSVGSTDRTLSQPTIALVGETDEEATYKVTFTASGISIQDPTAYYGIQLGGGPANRFTQNGTYTYWIVASDSGGGLEISSVNTTSGDTLTVDNISVIVEHFKPSTNLKAIIVTGDIKVPAGAQVLDDNAFGAWVLDEPYDNTLPDWALAETPSATNYYTYIDTGDGLKMVADGTGLTVSQNTLEDGKEYLLTLNGVTVVGFGFDIENGGKSIDSNITTGLTYQFVAQGTDITIFAASATVEIESIDLFELTDGPIDEYFDNGNEINNEPVYESVNAHADGSGGTAKWYVWRYTSAWIISLNPDTLDFPRWSGEPELINTYNPRNGPPATIGIATTTHGPTDHSEESGSAGFETSSGAIGLYGEYDEWNTDRELQWALVSVINPLSGNDDTDRVISFETADGVGYYWTKASAGVYNARWTGTSTLNLSFVAAEDTIHNLMNFSDIAATDSWLTVDGSNQDTQLNASGLDAVDPVKFVLGARADAAADFFNGQYGGQFRLDLTGVTANEAFKIGLATAINAAAIASNYDPHAIALAIYNYDNNIKGHYYALNELASGDASDYYLLAYDIQTQTAITQGVYGLTSPSGVTGTVLVPITGGGYRSRYQGLYRDRYNRGGR